MPCASYQCSSARRKSPFTSRMRATPFLFRQLPEPYVRRSRDSSRIPAPRAIVSTCDTPPTMSKFTARHTRCRRLLGRIADRVANGQLGKWCVASTHTSLEHPQPCNAQRLSQEPFKYTVKAAATPCQKPSSVSRRFSPQNAGASYGIGRQSTRLQKATMSSQNDTASPGRLPMRAPRLP